MKKIFLILALVASTLVACKKYEVVKPYTLPEVAQKMWVLESLQVTENGLPADDLTMYNGFTLQFVGEKYYVSNGNDAFPETEGKWRFSNDKFTEIVFDDEITAEVSRFNASELNFTFTRKGGLVNGRIPDRTFVFELVAFK
ncbi:MAG: hypothetical protein SFU27_11990 [Thermonemataceae bacterium]|nr:hypothetical protein [Thermonemataceae bacterium]